MDMGRQREALTPAASSQLGSRMSWGDEVVSLGMGRVLGHHTCAHAQHSPAWKSLCSAMPQRLSAPSQMQRLCSGNTHLTRNFGLCTLELVKFLQKPAWLEHGSLNSQNLALSHRGMCWYKCKCPNSNLHCLKTQARRWSTGRAAQRWEGCQMTGVALGMAFCAQLRRTREAGWAQAGGKAYPLL